MLRAGPIVASLTLAVLAPPAAAVQVGTRLPLPGRPEAIVGDADGTTRVAVGGRLDAPAASTVLARSGARFGAPAVLVGRTSIRGLPVTAMIPGGAVSAREVGRDGPNVIAVVERPARGRRGTPVIVSDRTRSAGEPTIAAGGGAVAVTYVDRGARGEADDRPMLAVRPRGERRFREPVPLDAEAPDGQLQYVVTLGARGAGAVVVGPRLSDDTSVRVRRPSARGTLGPWQAVTRPDFYTGTVAAGVTGDGTIAIAMAIGASSRDGDGPVPTLLSSSLPPGAGTPTPVQVLRTGVDDDILQEENLALATGAGDRAVMVSHLLGPARIQVYSGSAGALRPETSFRESIPGGARVTIARDGGTYLGWTHGRRSYSVPSRVVGAYRPPDGRFGRTRTMLVTRRPPEPGGTTTGTELTDLVPLGRRGAVATASDDTLDLSFPFVVRLNP